MTHLACVSCPGDVYKRGIAAQIEFFDIKEGPAKCDLCPYNAALVCWTRNGCARNFAYQTFISVLTGRKSNRRFASSSYRSRIVRSQLPGRQTINPDLRTPERNRQNGCGSREIRAIGAKPVLSHLAGGVGRTSGLHDYVRNVRDTLFRWRINRQVRIYLALSGNPRQATETGGRP